MDGTIPLDFMGEGGDDVLFLPDMSNIEDGVFPDEKWSNWFEQTNCLVEGCSFSLKILAQVW